MKRAFVLLVGGAYTLVSAGCAPRPVAAAATRPARAEDERAVLDADIEFYEARARRDPTGAADLAHAAALHLERSRQTGEQRDAVAAEREARRSIANRSAHNIGAQQVLASALLAQHRFDEALTVAKRVRDFDPASPSLRAMVAEIEMELGQYDSAKVAFAALGDAQRDLAVAPRLARWSEIRGHVDAARRYMRGAITVAESQPMLPSEQLGWFWLRAGDIELRDQRLAAADSAYQAGLRANPGDYRLLAAMARLSFARHDWTSAVRLGEESIAVNLDPATIGLVSDAYAALGDTVKADELARVLDVAVSKQPGAYHRAWSLFLLDHDRRVDVVSRKIRFEMKTRRDIYAYDLLAWSLHKQGHDTEAMKAMQVALSQGTRDPLLEHHADEIRRALAGGTAP